VPVKYPSSVRRQVCLRLRGGEPVAELAADTGISPATLFRWKAQALVDAGVNDGVPSVEADELAAAHRRITQLEAELALTRDACALFNDREVVSPKGKSRSSKD
jgi:transposase